MLPVLGRRCHVSRLLLPQNLLAVVLVPLLVAAAAAQMHTAYPAMEPEPSMGSKVSSSVKTGFSTMTPALTPRASTKEAPDPISLSVPAKPSADFHIAVARMAEQSGDSPKAEYHYRQALELAPKNLDALMGYAHMLDRQDKLAQAAEVYRLIIQAYPSNPAAHNDLGICYARQGKLQEAAVSIEKAIQLQPRQTRYRNNIATLLVQSNQVDRAFVHLSAVHPRAVACYNLGYLLQKAGDRAGATRLFQEALALDSSLTQARVWLEQVGPAISAAENAGSPVAIQSARQPQALAQRSAPKPTASVPQPGSPSTMPPAGSLAPLPQIPIATPATVPNQAPPRQLAPLPSLKPLPPIRGSY